MHPTNRILLISGDEETAGRIRDRLAGPGEYEVVYAPSGQKGLDALAEKSFDVVITEFDLLDIGGVDLIRIIRHTDPRSIIIALVDEDFVGAPNVLYKLGVYDFVIKPVNTDRLFFSVKRGAELHSLTLSHQRANESLKEHNTVLEKQNTLLGRRIEESTKNLTRLYDDLRATYLRTIKVLAQTIDARDHYTHCHSEHVARYAAAIADEMHVPAKDIEVLRQACELHDLGKIGVEDRVLSKPGPLNAEEWWQIRFHPVTAAQILEPLTFLAGVIEIVRQHHEHFDGTGYPDGRRGEDIVLGARILHCADAYEAMRTPRSYRKTPLTKQEALAEIHKYAGTQFDPQVVAAFGRVVDKVDV